MPGTGRAVAIGALGWLLCAPMLCAGSYETFTRKAAQGPKAKVIAAASFGAEGNSEFVAAGELADGSIVAFGNAWGPKFPSAPPPLVLGRGRHHRLDPYLNQTGQTKQQLREDDPDMAGMIVFYARDLATVRKVVRFDWGVATISAAVVLPAGRGMLISGRCTDAFGKAARKRLKVEAEAAGKDTGPYNYGQVRSPGDVFIARLPASGDGVLWAVVLPGARTPPATLWLDYEGNAYADVHGLVRIGPNGQTVTHVDIVVRSADGSSEHKILADTGTARYLGIDPRDGSFYFGGDRNTLTGYQTWRQPYLYKFDRDGRKLWKAWEWPPGECASGGTGNGLCSDSGPDIMDIAADGSVIIGGWSNGENSVFTRQPDDLDRPFNFKGFGMDASGMKGRCSPAYLLKVDPKTRKLTDGTIFRTYPPASIPDKRHRGVTNAIQLRDLAVAPNGAISFAGVAGAGLIQTPSALNKNPGTAVGYSGEFAAIFSPDFHNLIFSSYLPGCHKVRVSAAHERVIVVSRIKRENRQDNKEQAGEYAGRILLLALPDELPASKSGS